MTKEIESLNDITDLAHHIAQDFCAKQGLKPDDRDDYGRYRWESFVDEAREAIHLVRKWDEKQHQGSEISVADEQEIKKQISEILGIVAWHQRTAAIYETIKPYLRQPEPVSGRHWSDCKVNGYDSGEGIKYAPEAECDCGGYAEDAPTGNDGGLQDASSVQSSTSSAPNEQPKEPWKPCWGEPCTCGPGGYICPTCANNGAKTKEQPDELSDTQLLQIATSEFYRHTPEGYNWSSIALEAACKAYHLAKTPKRESGWHPISTAPKDATQVVLFGHAGGTDTYAVGFWNSDKLFWQLDVNGRFIMPNPTHWMPLPQPPENARQS